MNQLPENYCTLFARVSQQTAACQNLLLQLYSLSESSALPLGIASQLKQATASLALITEQLQAAQQEAELSFLEETDTLLSFPIAFEKKAI